RRGRAPQHHAPGGDHGGRRGTGELRPPVRVLRRGQRRGRLDGGADARGDLGREAVPDERQARGRVVGEVGTGGDHVRRQVRDAPVGPLRRPGRPPAGRRAGRESVVYGSRTGRGQG